MYRDESGLIGVGGLGLDMGMEESHVIACSERCVRNGYKDGSAGAAVRCFAVVFLVSKCVRIADGLFCLTFGIVICFECMPSY